MRGYIHEVVTSVLMLLGRYYMVPTVFISTFYVVFLHNLQYAQFSVNLFLIYSCSYLVTHNDSMQDGELAVQF